MTADPVDLAVELGRALPPADVRALATAARAGLPAVHRMRSDAGGVGVRTACARLVATDFAPDDRLMFAGALLATLHPDPQSAALDVVWTGPDTPVATGRLTSAVVVDLIGQAVTDILLIGYAVHTEPTITRALEQAHERGAAITLVLERHLDNPAFSGTSTPFPRLVATRLAWPASARPPGGSLHAKVIVVDGISALIGSANLTGAALSRNLECGLLVRGGPEPGAVRAHIRALLNIGLLERVD